MRYDELPKRDYDKATSQCAMRFLTNCRRSTPLLRLTSSNSEKNVLLVTRAENVLSIASDIGPFPSFDFHALVSLPLRLVRIGEPTEAAHG